MKFSYVTRAKDNVPRNKECKTRKDFERFLSSGMSFSKDGLCFLGCTFKPNAKRVMTDIESVTWLCLDLDDYSSSPSLFFDQLDFEWYAYSSWNDGNPNKDDRLRNRFRVLIPFSRPISLSEYAGVKSWADRKWGIKSKDNPGGILDKCIKCPSQIYYTPRQPNPESQREPWVYSRHGDVKRLNPYKLPGGGDCRRIAENEHTAAQSARKEFLDRHRQMALDVGVTRHTKAYLESALSGMIQDIENAPEGMRRETAHKMSYKIGGYMAQYPQVYTRGEIVSRFTGAVAKAGVAKHADLMDLKRQIENGLRDGSAKPLSVPAPESRPPMRVVGAAAGHTVGKVFPKAPCGDHEFPANYSVDKGGIWHAAPPKEGEEEPKLTMVSPRPILISRRFIDDEEREWVKLAWPRRGKWVECTIRRSKMLQTRDLVSSTADYGSPIDSNNARWILKYLVEYEQHNDHALYDARIVSQMGWHGDEFILGDQRIDADGCHDQDDKRLIFDPSKSDPSMIKALHSGGSFNAWKDAVSGLDEYPVVVVGLLAAAAAPLLAATHTDSFVVDQGDSTSGGKTIAQACAASLWGYPSKSDGIITTWSSTATYLGRCAAAFRHLPLFIDDTKEAPSTDFLAKQVYRLTSRDKGRGNVTGAQATASFHLVILTSGEDKLAGRITDDGARARIISVSGAPFGAKTDQTYYVVEALRQSVLENYGHLGPLLVQRLASAPKGHWRTLCDEVVTHYINLGANNSKVMRKARAFACMHIALDLVNDICGFNWSPSILEELWRSQNQDLAQRPKHELALEELRGEISSNSAKFWAGGSGAHEPGLGWWGRIDAPDEGCAPTEKHFVGIYPRVVRKVLGEWYENNFPRYWAESGMCNKGKIVKIKGKPARLMIFRYESIFPTVGDIQEDLLPF